MGTVTVVLHGKDGTAIPNAWIKSDQQEHAFAFGSAVKAKHLSTFAEDHPYKQEIKSLFNCAVLENAHKWKNMERTDVKAHADRALAWLVQQDIRVRGHTLVWQTKQFGKPMPNDVWGEVLKAEAGEPANLDYVRERINNRLSADVKALAGKLIAWDVTNEITAHHHAITVLEPDSPPRSAPIIADWYRRAHAADPGAQLFVNDYSILVGYNEKHRAGYEETIKSLLDVGAPLHGIGMQVHVTSAGARRPPEVIQEVLDRFATFELPIWITEFDMFGKNWGDTPEEKLAAHANCFRDYIITSFAHPRVEGFLVWGFWDGAHWAKEGPLFFKDWSAKPALAVYKDLVFNQWWSNKIAQTNEKGQAELRLFKGRHRLTVEHEGMRYQMEFYFSDGKHTQHVYLRGGTPIP